MMVNQAYMKLFCAMQVSCSGLLTSKSLLLRIFDQYKMFHFFSILMRVCSSVDMAVWMSIQMSAGSAHKCSLFNEHYKFSSIKFSFECWFQNSATMV